MRDLIANLLRDEIGEYVIQSKVLRFLSSSDSSDMSAKSVHGSRSNLNRVLNHLRDKIYGHSAEWSHTSRCCKD